MSLEAFTLHTISCDIPGCKEKRTAPTVAALRGEGWVRVEIFDREFEICPDHEDDLREFFLSASKS